MPTAANIRHYADIVRERSILRQLAATAGEIADSAYNPLGRDAKRVLDEAEAKVLHIAEQGARGRRTFALLKDLLVGVVDRIEALYSRDDPSDVTGIANGVLTARSENFNEVRIPLPRVVELEFNIYRRKPAPEVAEPESDIPVWVE